MGVLTDPATIAGYPQPEYKRINLCAHAYPLTYGESNMENLEMKSIAQLASIVRNDWKKVNYAAVPYLEAMADLRSIDDCYGYDDGRSIVRYFLGNATSWRGDVARAIKAELNRRIR